MITVYWMHEFQWHRSTKISVLVQYDDKLSTFQYLQCPIWIYDIIIKRITWANGALPLCQESSPYLNWRRAILVSRCQGDRSHSLKSIKDSFYEIKASRHGGTSHPSTLLSGRCVCSLGSHYQMAVPECWLQVIAEESSLKHDLACSDGSNLSLLLMNRER